MIADTTFLSDLHHEREQDRHGPAMRFLAARRNQVILTTVISAGELALIFPSLVDARRFLSHYRLLRLTPEVAYAAAEVDRELIQTGDRLGENDNWIAGFCRYYGQPIISRDGAFDRVQRLRRLTY